MKIMAPKNIISIVCSEDVPAAADLFLAGHILLLNLGGCYRFVFNPQIVGLSDAFNKITGGRLKIFSRGSKKIIYKLQEVGILEKRVILSRGDWSTAARYCH